MTAETVRQKVSDFVATHRVKIAGLGATAVSVAAASAETYDINGTVGPILDSVVALIPSIINLVIGLVPAIIVIAIVGFLLGFFDKILGMMKLR